MVSGLHGNKSPYSDRLIPVFQSLKMMYDYRLNLAVRTPRACPWMQSVIEELRNAPTAPMAKLNEDARWLEKTIMMRRSSAGEV